MQALLMLLLGLGGPAVIAVRLVADVEQISSAASATGDPIAHEMILDRMRQPPAIEE